MKRFLWAFAILALPAVSHAAPSVQSQQLVPVGYCQLTSLSSAVALSSCTGGIPKTAQVMLIVPETQAVRWRDDGTAPTGSVGMPIAANIALTYQGDMTKFKVIEQASSATVNISFYKYLP